ncbi:response regulator SirA [Shewanella sp. OPT22]|uniref:sulfurtransferase TusA family protein n=1 Tax=Parashewanella hymeniacidonis TaxID=2807618 RepID=UPI00102190B7|nr:sulfurtransferase TusA family protein [Parashewanella hymeniacidonis]MBM7073728.1 sulfurtransferase TusA family protein [Parashewanella hymeniacidonis]RYV01327.1 response regulator SirA [Shewanella sp. OPT22]
MLCIDLTNFRCPLPLVKTKLALKTLPEGEKLQVLLSDRNSRHDVPKYLIKEGYFVQEVSNSSELLELIVAKSNREQR